MGKDYIYEKGKDKCYEKLKRLFENTNKQRSSPSLLKKRQALKSLSKRLYKILPAVCWKSEVKLAKELGTSKRQLQLAKRYLHWTGKIRIQLRDNGNRINPVHYLYKVQSTAQRSNRSFLPIGWEDLCQFSAKEFNLLSISEQLDIYCEINMPCIPVYYPIIIPGEQAKCSCRKGQNCESIGKHPVVKWKNLDFSNRSTFQKMKSYWKESETPWNIAFLTKDFTVVDIDRRHNGDYSLGLLEEQFGEIPRGLAVASGNGFHLYTSDRIKCRGTMLGHTGIDICSNGGLITAPFSQHKSGQKYVWQSIGLPEPLPEQLLSEIEGPSYVKLTSEIKHGSKFRDFMSSTTPIVLGTRNNTLFGIACSLRGSGKNSSEIYLRIGEINRTRCMPPLTNTQVEGIAQSVMKYQTNFQKELALAP